MKSYKKLLKINEKSFLHFILILVLLCLSNNIKAQEIQISGIVYDSIINKPLSNVTIYVPSTIIGTTTNFDGQFSLTLPKQNIEEVVFSCLGYTSRNIKTTQINSKELIIKMSPSMKTLQEVVIQTTRSDMRKSAQTTSVSVISEDVITARSVQNISEIIHKEPSISFAGAAFHKSPSIRGLARKRIVVMVDGERISSERNAGVPGTFVNPQNIRNIEILRGPYSTLYGSDAIGGVVNIITKNSQQHLTNPYIGGLYSGNIQSIRKGYNTSLSLHTKISKQLYFYLSLAKRKAQCYRDAKGKEVAGTNFSEQSINPKIIWQPHKNHFLKIYGYFSFADSIGKPAFSDSINALHPKDNHLKIGINYKWNNITEWLPRMNLKISAHKHDITARIYNYRPIQYGRVINMQKNLYNTDYTYQQDFTILINPKIKLLTGIDFYQRDDIHIDEIKRAFLYAPEQGVFHLGETVYTGPQDTIIDDSYQRSTGFFLQGNFSISEKLYINAGLRYNIFRTKAKLIRTTNIYPYDYTLNTHLPPKIKQDKALSENIGIVYNPTKYLTLSGNAGQAFRTPSTKELFVNTMTPGGINISNPDLVPEKSTNFDIGIRLHDKTENYLMLSVFNNNIKDMIILAWDSLHTSGCFKNKDAVLYGMELMGEVHFFKHLYTKASVSYIYGTEKNGEVLMDIPPLTFNFDIAYQIIPQKLRFAIAGKISAEQTEIATGDVPTKAFHVFDILGVYSINKYFKAVASVNNLLNHHYREHYQFDWVRMPGRSFNLGIQIKF